jgi:hypothetical protein
MANLTRGTWVLGSLVLIGLLNYSCATRPVRPNSPVQLVKIDSIALADANLKGKTYTILSSIKGVGENDIQFKEIARYVDNALSMKGYMRRPSGQADLIVRLAYGVGAPQIETTSTTYATSTGYSYPVGWGWVHVAPKTETETKTKKTYERFLMLEAYDSKDPRSQQWRTTLKSEGWESELRSVIPRMLAASIPLIGSSTSGAETRGTHYHHPTVLEIIRSPDAKPESPSAEEGRLGIQWEPMNHGNQFWYRGRMAGVLVSRVEENSAAHQIGLRRFDVILAVNGGVADKPDIVAEQIRNTRTGGSIRLVYFSWEKDQAVSVAAQLP